MKRTICVPPASRPQKLRPEAGPTLGPGSATRGTVAGASGAWAG